MTESDLKKTVGANVRKLRRALGLTQASLSELAELEVVSVQSIELGLRFPSAKTFVSLSRFLKVPVHEFLVPTKLVKAKKGRPKT